MIENSDLNITIITNLKIDIHVHVINNVTDVQ